jgi:hypothetical protein
VLNKLLPYKEKLRWKNTIIEQQRNEKWYITWLPGALTEDGALKREGWAVGNWIPLMDFGFESAWPGGATGDPERDNCERAESRGFAFVATGGTAFCALKGSKADQSLLLGPADRELICWGRLGWLWACGCTCGCGAGGEALGCSRSSLKSIRLTTGCGSSFFGCAAGCTVACTEGCVVVKSPGPEPMLLAEEILYNFYVNVRLAFKLK